MFVEWIRDLCLQTVFIYIMYKELDAVESKVMEILKDFNDQMKK